MASESGELKISYELTEIFRRSRAEVPESTAEKFEGIWTGLEMVVAEINRAREGKSAVSALNGMDPKEAMRMAEMAALRRLNQVWREELEKAGKSTENAERPE